MKSTPVAIHQRHRPVSPPAITASMLVMGRAALGWTQERLATELGLATRSVADWERGLYRLSGERCKAVLDVFLQHGVVFPTGGIIDAKYRGVGQEIKGESVAKLNSDALWLVQTVPAERLRPRPERRKKKPDAEETKSSAG